MIFASRHIRSPALSKAPIGLSMRTGTGQTLPVGTVFRCTEGNRWDIRQLPEPAGWFYIAIPGIFWSTNEYRHDILQQPEPAGGYNRTTNNCECIDCSILVFLDCFLSVL